MQTRLKSLSVFFPCYNEEKNVEENVKKTKAVMPDICDDFEIILVNDGSRDRTGEVADRLAKEDPRVKAVHHPKNRGYGGAVKSGFAAAQKEWVFFSDGDLQFDLSELKSFVPHTSEYDAVIGYRIKRAEGFGRARNAFLFKMFVTSLFQLGVKDIDCAFKLIRTSQVKKINLTSDGAVISTELLFKLKRNGVKFKQLPVHHFLRQYGTQTGANLKVILKAGIESLKLFYRTRILGH
jgi:glycosyltransferase involved in cell wall biosynthesis